MRLKLGDHKVNIEDIERCRSNNPWNNNFEDMKPFLYVKLKTGEEIFAETVELIDESIKRTPEELAEVMEQVSKETDKELKHKWADDLLCETLKALGYDKAVNIFTNMDK